MTSKSPAGEAAARRHALRRAESLIAELRAANLEHARMLIGLHLQGVLADPAVFDERVGVVNVVDDRGRIVWREVQARTVALLRQSPELAPGVAKHREQH